MVGDKNLNIVEMIKLMLMNLVVVIFMEEGREGLIYLFLKCVLF